MLRSAAILCPLPFLRAMADSADRATVWLTAFRLSFGQGQPSRAQACRHLSVARPERRGFLRKLLAGREAEDFVSGRRDSSRLECSFVSFVVKTVPPPRHTL